FGTLIVPYEHAQAAPDPQEGSRSTVDAVQLVLVRADLSLSCKEVSNGWRLDLSQAPVLDERVDVWCRPVTLPGARARQVRERDVSFDGLSIEALTAFICFRLSCGTGEAKYENELTLKLPIQGLPAERDAQISRSIIKDRTSFLRYLHCLLGGAGETL